MKLFIPILGLLSMVLAEPPVGDGYPAARSHKHDHDLSRSISQEYGLPETFGPSRNGLSTEYGLPTRNSSPDGLSRSLEYLPPNARTAGTRKYSPPAAIVSISHNYRSRSKGLARNTQGYARNTPSQNYGVPRSLSDDLRAIEVTPSSEDVTRLSPGFAAPHHQENEVPNTRGVSQEYGLQNSLSQEYNAPVSSRTLSSEYGIPDSRSTPNEEYGAPAITRSSSNAISFNTNAKSFSNSQTSAKSSNISPLRSNVVSQTYSAPKSGSSGLSAKTSLNSLGPYAARESDSYSQEYNVPSESYGLPAVRDLSDTYGTPKGLSQEYESRSRANLKTNAIASSYSSAKSSSSSTYLPSAHSSMPSKQYGTPDQYASNQGYNYERGSLEDSYQEPANYGFMYKVNDFESGSDFGHSETREENRAEGSYFVLLPDGTKQTVEYEADEDGFKPRISVEQPLAGYDDHSSGSEGY